MNRIDLTRQPIQAYHEGMLLVKTRATVQMAEMAAAPARAAAVAEGAGTPGLSALQTLERAGLVKRITPLANPTIPAGAMMEARGVMEALAMPLPTAETDPNAGVSIVELEHERDVDELQRALANDPNIEAVARVPVRYWVARKRPTQAAAAPGAGILAVPPPAAALWNLTKIRWAAARSLPGFKEASNLRVAVLDTGIDVQHPDLQGRINNYVYKHPDLPRASSRKDLIGHGTHVAGTIAALSNNHVGINGICETQLHIWKIFDDRPDFSRWDNEYVYYVEPIMYRRALSDCLAAGINVINLSIGGPTPPDFVESLLFRRLLARGATIVAAMGNEGPTGPTSYPAGIPGVIAVGATKLDDKITNFSCVGNHIALCAPGAGIWSTLPTYAGQFGFTNQGTIDRPRRGTPIPRDTDYDSWDGTSMASPHVAAAASLLIANKGAMDPAAVRQRLMQTADKVPAMQGANHTIVYGAGRLNLLRLLSE